MQEEWTEKYRPSSLSQVIGNDSAVRAMRRWAESWSKGPPRSRALVLRGEPGIGKTSSALALARDMSWDYIEMNASDHRNAASIRKVAGAGSTSQTSTLDGDFMSSSHGKRKLVIIDEADNLFGREDYGGAKEIVETIRNSGQPIVLIVNDYSELSRKSPAIRQLAEKVDFRRLDSKAIVGLLGSIAEKENVRVPQRLLEQIAENAGGDMRAAVNDLQMMVEGKTALETADGDAMGKRNQEKSLATCLRAMFGAKTLREARDATLDLDMTPDELEKWIEESIPAELRTAEELSLAFDSLSRSDVYLGQTRRLQHYGLWAYAKEMMTGGVSLSRRGTPRPAHVEYRFPSHFIVLSRAKGFRAARDSVSSKLAGFLHTSRRCVNESALPYLAAISKNDHDLLVALCSETGLDEGDVAYLLDADPDSKEVDEIMSRVRSVKGIAEPDDKTGKGRGRPRGPKRGIADF